MLKLQYILLCWSAIILISDLVFSGSIPSSGYDGAGLCSHCRDQSVLLRFLWCPSAGQEDCHHIQTVLRTAQFSGTVTIYTDDCLLLYCNVTKNVLFWYFIRTTMTLVWEPSSLSSQQLVTWRDSTQTWTR